MDIQIKKDNLEKDFNEYFSATIDKFQINDIENFKNDLFKFIDSININKADIEEISNGYDRIIEKYSNIEDIVNIALEERKEWQ